MDKPEIEICKAFAKVGYAMDVEAAPPGKRFVDRLLVQPYFPPISMRSLQQDTPAIADAAPRTVFSTCCAAHGAPPSRAGL